MGLEHIREGFIDLERWYYYGVKSVFVVVETLACSLLFLVRDNQPQRLQVIKFALKMLKAFEDASRPSLPDSIAQMLTQLDVPLNSTATRPFEQSVGKANLTKR